MSNHIAVPKMSREFFRAYALHPCDSPDWQTWCGGSSLDNESVDLYASRDAVTAKNGSKANRARRAR